MSRFHNSLYLGDVQERIRVLEEVGQTALAYITAATHGLQEEADALAQKLQSANPDVPIKLPPINSKAYLMQPPIPIMKLHESNWPLLTVSKGYFDGAVLGDEDQKKFTAGPADLLDDNEVGEAWGEDALEDEEGVSKPGKEPSEEKMEETEEGGGWDMDLDLGEVEKIEVPTTKADKNFLVLPQSGPTYTQIWCNNSLLAADHVAGGSFESAMKLLNNQIGVVNFAPLKPYFISLFMAAKGTLPANASTFALTSPMQRNIEVGPKSGLPSLPFALQSIIENQLKAAYRATTAGKFGESLALFISIVQMIPLLVVDSKKEANEGKELLAICKEYITGLRMELKRKDEDPVRQAELAAYFTHCNLQQIHLLLCVRSAMNCCVKIKNFQLAAVFARRLLELEPKSDVAAQAKKVIMHAETNNENAQPMNYNDKNPFVVCGISFTPIYRGNPVATCSFCQSSFLPVHKGKLCPNCQLSEIGKEVSGLTLYAIPQKQAKQTKKASRNDDDDDF